MAEERKASAGLVADRPQPSVPDIERACLASMLRDPEVCVDLALAQLHGDNIFYSPAHRAIFDAIKTLHGDRNIRIDMLSVAQYLREHDKLDAVGGELYLAELELAVPTTVNLENWCRILSKYAMLRRMIGVLSNSLLKCYDADLDASTLVDEIENDVYKVRYENVSNEVLEVQGLIENEFQTLLAMQNGQRDVGISTGYSQLDEFTGGLKPGEMFVLAARPSIGKTSLALNVIANVAYKCPKPRPVAFFSLEMTAEQIVRRLLCTEAGVAESVFWNRSFQMSEITKLTGAVTRIRDARLFIDPTPGISIAELRAKVRRLKAQHNIELVVIDYLQLMHSESRNFKQDSRQQEVAEISGGIKALAKDLKIPVLVLAQLNREVDKAAGNARPKLAHLRESGTIEQDADIVTFLHRNRDETKGDVTSAEAEWIIEKNRNGRTGVIKLLFYPSRMEFVAAAPVSGAFAPEARKN